LTADDKTFDKIKEVFKTLIPNLADIKKENYGGFYKIVYQEKSDNGEQFDPVELSDLAAGYRGIITMIGDMLAHFIPQVSSSLDLSKDIGGIVIIDEFDAHLHPKYQYELPSLLSKVFPNVQFIVSTHSPIPLLGVEPKTAVVFTVNRTKEEGITIHRLDTEIEIDKLSANALLTSDIFGFKDIFARGSTPDTIEPFNNYDDIKQMKEPEKLSILKSGLKALKIKL
jgi:predicted ATP-binding protein involved in virulence